MAQGAHIFVSDLRLQARVGVNPGEQGAEQPVVLDIWVGLEDVARAARSERLRHTVDYVGVAHAARAVVAARHYPLVESLAACIAEAVLERPGAAWARVRLRKLKCLRYASGAGVEVELHREQPTHPRPATLPDGAREEIVIVGGGVAGVAAAVWCDSLGHRPLLVEAEPRLGGQLHLVHGLMHDLPALEPMTGLQLAGRLWRQLRRHGGRWARGYLAALETGAAGCNLELQQDQQRIQLRADAVILATGVRRRRLDVPGELRLLGRGILHTGAKDNAELSGKRVAVIGGGDAATENALILAEVGARVTLLHRGAELSARAQFRRAVAQHPRIEVRKEIEVRGFGGDDRLESLDLQGPAGRETLAVDAALVRIGWEPNSQELPAGWLDDSGHVRADQDGRVAGEHQVFAAGDVLGRLAPSVAASSGSAAVAAAAAVQLLEDV